MISLVEMKDIPSVEEVKDVPLEVNLMEIFKISKEMETLCLKENGIGLSAVQVGIPLKLFVVKKLDKDTKYKFDYYINTRYCPFAEDKIISLEGCLSIRSPSGQLRHFQVPRYREIMLNGYKLDFTGLDLRLQLLEDVKITDDQSIVFQHEIDHQNGITIDQIGQEIFLW